THHPSTSIRLSLFLFNDPLTPHTSTLSLHDALPICHRPYWALGEWKINRHNPTQGEMRTAQEFGRNRRQRPCCLRFRCVGPRRRSEEHTSELQSRFDLVCRLLLEKKK